MKNKTAFQLVAAAVLVATCSLASPLLRADESVGNQIKDAQGDVKTTVRKSKRDLKRKGRKVKGDDNVLKDAKDKTQDAGDSVSNDAKKLEHKAE